MAGIIFTHFQQTVFFPPRRASSPLLEQPPQTPPPTPALPQGVPPPLPPPVPVQGVPPVPNPSPCPLLPLGAPTHPSPPPAHSGAPTLFPTVTHASQAPTNQVT